MSEPQSLPPPPIRLTAFVRSSFLLANAADADDFCRRYSPVVHTHKDGAINEALLAAPTEETPEDLFLDLATVMGGIASISPEIPRHVAYLGELQFVGLRVETTSLRRKADHLGFAERKDPPDALWLPSESEDSPGQRLRIIAKKSLRGRIAVVRSVVIPLSLPAAPPYLRGA
jgi:hypothetical protein